MKKLILRIFALVSALLAALVAMTAWHLYHPGPSRQLWNASARGDVAGARQALSEGADPNWHLRDFVFGDTALMNAARSRNLDLVRLLLDAGADPNLQNNRGDTALISAVYWGDDYTNVVELLIEEGADVKSRNNYGVSALRLAVGHIPPCPGIVRILKEHGARE